MTKRIVMAGVVAGLVLFFWSFISHLVLPLGEVGVSSLPADETISPLLRENITEPGFYFFPGMEERPGMSEEEAEAAWNAFLEKAERGPWGVIIYHPEGLDPLSMGSMVGELLLNITVCLLAAFLVSVTTLGFGGRVLFVALLGAFAAINVHVSYWNWYGFPADYTAGVMVDEIMGFFLAGVAISWVVRSVDGRQSTVAGRPG